ncbi:MAG: hypothetical protein K8R53_12320, partial [Bacteroidales bacterium]|nr:hypothetical protein [Bacteroidales bacterium]
MKARILTYSLLLLLALNSFSQNNGAFPKFWRLTTLDGELMLKGLYRDRNYTLKDNYEHQKNTYLSGGIKLNTESYIWHPNFLLVDFGGEYNSLSDQDDYLVNPDRSEIRTLKGLNIGTTLLNNKPVTIKSWGSWDDTYSNRELLTNIKTITKRWGSSLSYRNKLLPVNLSYNRTKWDQKEVQTGRVYLTEHENFEASTRKSFATHDRHELTFSHNDYFRREANLFEVHSITDIIRLNNNLFLDKKRNYSFRSLIYDYNRKGSPFF